MSLHCGGGGLDGLRARLHDGLRGLDLLLGLDELVAGDRAGGFGGFLQAVVSGLYTSELGLGLGSFGLADWTFDSASATCA